MSAKCVTMEYAKSENSKTEIKCSSNQHCFPYLKEGLRENKMLLKLALFTYKNERSKRTKYSSNHFIFISSTKSDLWVEYSCIPKSNIHLWIILQKEGVVVINLHDVLDDDWEQHTHSWVASLCIRGAHYADLFPIFGWLIETGQV